MIPHHGEAYGVRSYLDPVLIISELAKCPKYTRTVLRGVLKHHQLSLGRSGDWRGQISRDLI